MRSWPQKFYGSATRFLKETGLLNFERQVLQARYDLN
ncbi:hypothetical protein MiSe_83000 [Microseira wollei NIES-4236]|uniref:Transposase n=1 Tax=Microseira wollei NIES-4236 TaxID=2530354 RepID=A0AAV3XP46_9CYAN|nr:hypothetical protein MiSe_83000 [Microseira wollei NIES-4236]